MEPTKEQLQAINESGQNIIVSAGAGSGKTAVLTKRVLRILKEGTHVNELLVLTFTKAAAAEMKERIRNAIMEDPSLKKELELVDQSYITTFDSYALSVVKKYHYLLNISNNIAISESTIIEMKQDEILDSIFERYYTERPVEFSKLIKDFCVKDDKTIKESILKVATKIDSMPNREEYLNTYLDKYTNDAYVDELEKAYLDYVDSLKQELNNAYENLASYLTENQLTKLEEHSKNLYYAKNYNEYFNAINALTKFPGLTLDDDAKKVKETYQKLLKEFKELITKYGTKEENRAGILKSHTYIKGILNLVRDYLTELHTYKSQNEIYDFQDIALLSIKILEENEFVRNEIRDSFKHIMVDEYQDTNDIQETFISLIENNNVYMVGDIKQSIYRFRNANPYIFKNKYDAYAKKEHGIKIDLLKNFRSRSEVLKGINDVFDLIMDDVIGGADYQVSHRMVYGNETYSNEGNTKENYNLEILEYPYDKETPYDKEVIEAFAVAEDIKAKIKNKYPIFEVKGSKEIRPATYSDFVILMDRSTDFDLYKKIFEYLGIPLTLYKDETISDSDDIYILKNIIDFIVKINLQEFDETFKYDFMSIARSYLYNYTDQEIFNYFLNDNITESSIYNDFLSISEELTHLTTSDLLDSIIKKTNMYEKLITTKDIDASITRISKLLDIATNLSELGYDIYTFRNYLNDLIDNEHEMKYSLEETDSNAVRIMTIHKSKGLEYHICYYPGLSKEFNIKDLNDRILFDNKYGIISPYFEEGIHDSITKQLVKNHYLEEEVSERIRLFYVALTRAQEKMILITPNTDGEDYVNNIVDINKRRKYRSFTQVLNSIKNNIKDYYQELDINSLNITDKYLYNKTKEDKLIDNTIKPLELKTISIPESSELENKHFSKTTHELINKNTYDNMKLGLKVHEIFELLDFKNPDYSLIEDDFIKDKVKKFLSLKELKDISKSTIYKEHEFIYELDNTEYHGIIDLMVEYEDHIDIIDYKLNNVKDENYLNQLNGYKNYISTISNKEINIYLYSIIGETLEKL